jgi:hypothetical protein
MVVSPAVVSKGKKSNTSAGVSFADMAGRQPTPSTSKSSPVASTSRVQVEGDINMDDNDDVEGDGEWQSRQSVGHPATANSTSDKQQQETGNEDDDEAVMIDPDTILPPVAGTSSAGNSQAAEQGALKFPALSAKDMQGKVETQSRKVSVRTAQQFRTFSLFRGVPVVKAGADSNLSSSSRHSEISLCTCP